MTELKIAFWNLQNLFDTKLSEIAADFEYTPNEGWDQDAFDAKIKNLAQIIDLMHNGKGPDLFGVCEVENKDVAEELINACKRNDYELAHIESDDIRGIDTSLIYSKDIFEIIGDPKGHNVHLRYPTRDIFQVDLKSLGYQKLLGSGKIDKPVEIRTDLFSKKAEDKIIKARGKVIKEQKLSEKEEGS